MSDLRLSVAVGDYDRNRALFDGKVQIDGVDPVFMKLSPEEIFFRAFRNQDFDVCEVSLSSYVVSIAKGTNHYIAVPAYLSRSFRHSSIYIRTDKGIEKPSDLSGRRVGIAEYQLTANVWARAILEDDYGVKPSDITWVRGGMETADRPEKIKLDLPEDVVIEPAPAGKSLNELLMTGEIDGFIGPRSLSCFDLGYPHVGRLFPNLVEAATDYYQRTQIFPVMHLLGVRARLADEHPWLPAALFKAFSQSKDRAIAMMDDTAASNVTLPFLTERVESARTLLGRDFWSYGLGPNKAGLENFLHHHHKQGLSHRLVSVEELFHPGAMEQFTV